MGLSKRSCQIAAASLLVFFVYPFTFAETLYNESPRDTFGIEKFYPTKSGTVEWNSLHWANGHERGIDWDGDPDDPLLVSCRSGALYTRRSRCGYQGRSCWGKGSGCC